MATISIVAQREARRPWRRAGAGRTALGCPGSPLLSTDRMPESQRRVQGARHVRAHQAFEEATGSLRDTIPGSEIITA